MEDNKVIGNINTVSTENTLGIQSENSPFAESFYFVDVYDDTAVKKFIKATERLIRQSREYKTYIEELRTNVHQLNYDNILSNISTGDVDLEFHHYPFSLYDIVSIVMLKNLVDEKPFTSFSIAKEVMELHYKHYIGIVPLTKTMHELAHSGSIFIALKQVFGDFRTFMKEYDSGVSYDLKNKIKHLDEYIEVGVVSDFKGLLWV